MRMRVEELALAAEVSVDTVRYYQKQRLLPPPLRDGRLAYYGDEHLDRIARIKELQRRGFTLAVIRRFVAGELDPADESLAAAVAGAGDGDADEERFGIEELANRVGVPQPMLDALLREGLLIPRLVDGQPSFTSSDVTMLRGGLRLLEAGLPLPELFALARHHHRVTREVAVEAVELFDTWVRKPLRASDLPEDEKAERLVEAFRTLLPAVTSLVAHHFGRILLQVAQEHLESVGDQRELEAAAADEAWSA
ncbi:MAG: helix-turn-helix domain-containing protein [Actinomycetota bacterium]|nr:helix-turn-helix domain-containing protein [Actinomycetota bacterium]